MKFFVAVSFFLACGLALGQAQERKIEKGNLNLLGYWDFDDADAIEEDAVVIDLAPVLAPPPQRCLCCGFLEPWKADMVGKGLLATLRRQRASDAFGVKGLLATPSASKG